MNQQIGNIIGDLIPLSFFVYLALIMRGTIKLKMDIPRFTNPSVLTKILVYGVILFFIALLAIQILRL
jgi:hypothetical protein